MLAFGVLRGIAVMPGVGFGYPCSTYVPCLFAFRASADEETEMPGAQTINPSRTDVLLLLAITMEFLPRFLSAPGNSGAYGRRSQWNLARSEWLLVARAVPQRLELKANGIRLTRFPVQV